MNSGGVSTGGGNKGNGSVAAAGIPVGLRKIVQSLKEIVNLPDQEIYATLRECGMDPSEAVQRLLSQDSFHEVKSKRERKKETKEPRDSRSRTTNNALGRDSRGISDRVPRTSPIVSSSNDYGGSYGKAVQKKDEGAGSVQSSSNVGFRSSVSRKSAIISENASSENLWQATGSVNGGSLHPQPSGHPHTWAGLPGHFSMADIVKMGRPQAKTPVSSTLTGNSVYSSHNQITSDASEKYSPNPVWPSDHDQRVHSSQIPHQPAEDINIEPGATRNEYASDDGWPSVNQSNPGTTPAILEISRAATSYPDASKVDLIVDEASLHHTLNENEVVEFDQSSNSESSIESLSEREIQENTSENESQPDVVSQQNTSVYSSQRHLFEQPVDDANVEISSAAANLQSVRLQNDGLTAPSLEDNPAVIIPRHLQVTNADCSHLSFGSFGSGLGTSFTGSLQQKPMQDNSEVTKVADDVPSLDHSESRNSNYYDNDELKSQINEDVVSRGGINAINYDISSVSEPELIRDDSVNSTHELQYNFPSLSGYGTSTSAQHNSASFSHPQTNLQMQNLTTLSTLMQPYSSSLPSSLLAPTLQPTHQPLRDIDLPFSSLLSNQSLSTKHSATTSISGPTISINEPKPSVFTNLQQVPQSSTSPSLPSGHPIPQHLHINPYSQASLPLGPFANVISYPFLPQSYTYLSSAAFPQAYTSNGPPFHQSASAVHNTGLKYTLPQYKSSLSVASLPQPATAASPYGNYNGSANVPGNFVLNPSTTSTSTTIGFDEVLNAQKEGAHYLHFQQNDSSPMWVHNGGSRTVAPLPPNTFYGFQGQNHQLNSFRQTQQPTHYGPMGYLNMYQNHQIGGGQPPEHQQNPGEASLNGSQGNPSQTHQIWQHGY